MSSLNNKRGNHLIILWENIFRESLGSIYFCHLFRQKYFSSLACVASVSVGLSARWRRFSLFGCAKIGASVTFPAARKAESASNVPKALPKRLLRRLFPLLKQNSCTQSLITDIQKLSQYSIFMFIKAFLSSSVAKRSPKRNCLDESSSPGEHN